MSKSHHAEWLSLLDISGPFLSPPVLTRVFPQGLEAADPDHSSKLRMAYEEWAEAQQKDRPDPGIHDAWIRLVLNETLGYTPEVLREREGIPAGLHFTSPEHRETSKPDFAVMDPASDADAQETRLLIATWPPETDLEKPVDGSRWIASPIDRMVALCRAGDVNVRLGLVTNGERWALVDAPIGETSAHASWYASLWGSEALTLRAFQSLLGLRRFFGVADSDRLEAMLSESASYQNEVTDQLGFQVRRAVEVLVQAIDRADADTGRALLRDLEPARIYEAALTVMMRLVFLFSAEERGLLRLGDPLYDQFYAVSTLRAQLRESADQVGVEVLERRRDAWSRLLGTFRAIYGGVHHEALQIMPYGSSLFDPDRFPFLEGRNTGTSWKSTEADPLPIDNRTVLLLLESLQLLDHGPGQGARKLSFRALDIEQIGHVYETLLDHSAYRATEPMVSLQGNQGREPEIPVSTLHELVLQEGDEALVEFLKSELKKGSSPLRKALEKKLQPENFARLRSACGGDEVLLAKLLPFHDLIRLDPWDDPVVIREGAVFVTAGEDRRSTGTHYTPRVLTEEIVRYALEPVVYRGPGAGKDRTEWQLKSADEILKLKVCDPAMGSGAFLVQACRYLSERLVEAWEEAHQESVDARRDVVPADVDERLSLARRMVADRCLYGVDVNPLAVEMAKLSIWLITLAKDSPFSFVDHALRCGDSLMGIHAVDQVRHFHVEPLRGRDLHQTLFDPTQAINDVLERASELRVKLEEIRVRDIYDNELKQHLFTESDQAVDALRQVANRLMATAINSDAGAPLDSALATEVDRVGAFLTAPTAQTNEIRVEGVEYSNRQFHWPLEFPEVFARPEAGFDVLIGNPPFVGNTYWKRRLGDRFFRVSDIIVGTRPGKIDLCVLFIRRAWALLSATGYAGFLTALNAAYGDSARVGMSWIADRGVIPRAVTDLAWPGEAAVHVNIVWFGRSWQGSANLDYREVAGIDGFLRSEVPGERRLSPLASGGLSAFEGSHNGRGLSFLLTPDQDWFARLQESESPFLRPYVSGEDIASHGLLATPRWCVDTLDLDLDEVRSQSPETYEFLLAVVAPTRTEEILAPYAGLLERWWQFWNHRAPLYERLRQRDQCHVIPKVSKHAIVLPAPTSWVFTEKVRVVESPGIDQVPVLYSDLFTGWIWRYSSRMEQRLSVTLDAVTTFPLPERGPAGATGDAWVAELHGFVHRGLRVTQALNAMHDPSDSSEPAGRLRILRSRLTSEALEAYGWTDIEPNHGFHRTASGIRWKLEAAQWDEILRRLVDLNLSRSDVGNLS